MQLLFSVTAAAAALATVQGASEMFETAHRELTGCHLGFGSCVFWRGTERIGVVPLTLEQCVNVPSARWIWFFTPDALEAEAASADQRIQMARVSDSVTADEFKAASGVENDAFLFCEGATYVVLDTFGLPNLDGLVDFQFAMPYALKFNTALFNFPAPQTLSDSNEDAPADYMASDEPFLVRAILSPASRMSARQVAARISQEQKRRRRLGSSLPDTEAVVMVELSQRLELNAPVSNVIVSVTGKSGLDALASLPDVISVEPYVESDTNNAEATLIVMENIENWGDYGEGVIDNTTVSDQFSLWNAGVDGTGQVVGVGDTGLDTEHCFFSDENADDAANKVERVTSNSKTHNYPGHRKVVQYVSFKDGLEGSESGHGTHVAGTVAGSLSYATQGQGQKLGTGSQLYDAGDFQGIAPGSKLAFFDMATPAERGIYTPTDLTDLFAPSYDVGARIHTNSWGGSLSAYLSHAKDVDKFMYEHQDMLILFAAGNTGARSFTVSNQAQAKNSIAVGGSLNSDRSFAILADAFDNQNIKCPVRNISPKNCAQSIASFSAQGPTFDNRIKPDIIAPAQFVSSAKSAGGNGTTAEPTCGLLSLQGTSMATPLIAGSAALIRQFFVDGYYPSGFRNAADGFNPMGALVKAVLIDGAEYVQGVTDTSPVLSLDGTNKPTPFQGFGRAYLRNTLKLEGSQTKGVRNVWLKGDFADMPTLSRAQMNQTYTFDLHANEPFKATLVWSDAQASSLVTKAIVNDLDIKVIDPNGVEVFPNGLGRPDRTNTVEKIEIPAASIVEGEYTVIVSAHKLKFDNQPFAIVVSGSFQDVTYRPTTSPTSATSFPTKAPTNVPSVSPTKAPSTSPTTSPSAAPTQSPVVEAALETQKEETSQEVPIGALAGGIAGGLFILGAVAFAVGLNKFNRRPSREPVLVAKALSVPQDFESL